jgi:hypothetical protein
LLVGVVRLWIAARSRRSEKVQLAAALIATGTAFLLATPRLFVWFDRHVFHAANMSAFASHLLTVIGAWAGASMVSSQVVKCATRATTLRLPAEVSLLALMAIAFLRARPTVETPLFYEAFGRDVHLRT